MTIDDSFFYLFSGLAFGLAAGFSPGPVLTLVISETLRYGFKAGLKVAFSPLITDLPIILICVFVLEFFSYFHWILAVISILGGIYLIFLAFESFRIKQEEMDIKKLKPKSLQKGTIANFLNPAPYLFWISIGAPTVIKASTISSWLVFFYVFGMYFLLVGSKIFIAFLTGKSKPFIQSKLYVYINYFLGFVLLIFAGIFIYRGVIFESGLF
jgi:threonine/homoserine/homoserine lactone efflux protein